MMLKYSDPPVQKNTAISNLLDSLGSTTDTKRSAPLGNNTPSFKLDPSSTDHASELLQPSERRKKHNPALLTANQMLDNRLKDDITKQIKRRWKAGDVYAPHDLSGVEVQKWSKNEQPSRDIFDMLNFDPLSNYWV